MRSADQGRSPEDAEDAPPAIVIDRELRGTIPSHISRSLAEEVIARLAVKIPENMRDHAGPATLARLQRPPSAEVIEEFCDALVSPDPDRGRRMIDRAQLKGASADALYLNYIATAARRLGERWSEDTASFFDVTVGLSRLHMILRDIRPAFLGSEIMETPGCTAYFAPAPGEAHSLGVVMASDYFRRSGWRVDLALNPSRDDLVAWAARSPYAVIGLSASSRRVVDDLAGTVGELKEVCQGARIVIGGKIVELEPTIDAITGADLTIRDAAAAALSLKRFARTTA